jgi:tetratricopeptide (TPR) repeat protein
VSGETLARLRSLQACVFFWMAQLPRVLELGIPALEGLKAGSPLWCRLIATLIIGGYYSKRPQLVSSLREVLVHTTPEPEAVESYIEAVVIVEGTLIWFGERQNTETQLERLMEMGAGVMAHSPMARGFVGMLKSQATYLLEACPWRSFEMAEQGQRDFSAVGSERNALVMQVLAGMCLAATGELPGAVAILREALATARRTEQHLLVESSLFVLGMTLADSPEQGDREAAHAWALEWSERECVYPFIPGMAHAVLARMAAARGALREAESHARRACEVLAPFQVYVMFARTALSTSLLAQGRAAEAREVAELGVRELERMRSEGVYAVAMYLALAEACFAQGDAGAGEAALSKALRCVRARASDFPEPAARERFLRQVSENARTLELARQRWGEATA